jgi:hypothetical protein
LSRALIALGADVIEPHLRTAMTSENANVNAHATATERLLRNPDAAFGPALDEAKRAFALHNAPRPD